MSVTLSSRVAEAIIETAASAGFRGRRLLLDRLFDLAPAAVFSLLEDRCDTSVRIVGQPGVAPVEMRAIKLDGQVLIPYLVDELSGQNAGTNQGSRGFAATLRTQFAQGHDERVLVICDSAAVETVSTATESVASLKRVGWDVLVQNELEHVADEAEHTPTEVEREIAKQFAIEAEPTSENFARFRDWLVEFVGTSATALGSSLWKLGCFLSDPDVHEHASRRLKDGARLRRRIDALFASSSKSFGSEVRKLVTRGGGPSESADRIIAAVGAFALDYGAFSYEDAMARPSELDPLRTDQISPISGARLVLRQKDGLIVWLQTGQAELQLRLSRPLLSGEVVELRWATGDTADLAIAAGASSGGLLVGEAPERQWAFGVLTVGRRDAADGPIVASERLEVAVHRSDADWFAVEADRVVDAAERAFIAEHDPVAAVFEPAGSVAIYPMGEAVSQDDLRAELEVHHGTEICLLPVILLGDGPGGGESAPPLDDEPEDEPRTEPTADDVFDSIPHALLHLQQTEWPAGARLRNPLTASTADAVSFLVGSRHISVVSPHPGGLDGNRVEKLILAMPGATSFVWSPDPEQLRSAPRSLSSDARLDAGVLERFLDARVEFFAVASTHGSVYAVDPREPQALAYVDAYVDLLESLPDGAPFDDSWEALLICDSVRVAGRPDELWLAPTSPLAVAFHLELTDRVLDWVAQLDVPDQGYLSAVSLQHALPLLRADDRDYEVVPSQELLWRRYSILRVASESEPARNVRFIAQRLRFFLRVHPAYADEAFVARQTLKLTFANAGSADTVLGALADFFRSEKRDADGYSLPRLDVTLVDDEPLTQRALDDALNDAGRDDLVRLVQSRVVLRTASAPPEFSHIAFVFRTPGSRQPRKLDMRARPATTYLDGLATTPARHVVQDGEVSAWGTWAPKRAGGGRYARMMTAGLELTGAPGNKLDRGWTNYIATTIDRDELQARYSDRAIWVVHLDRLLGLEAFRGDHGHLIEYEDRADPGTPGYDGITTTKYIEPYRDAIARALGSVGVSRNSLDSDAGLEHILQRLNAVSGRWAIEILQRGDQDILRTIGFVAAISAIEQLEGVIGSDESGTGILIALDDFVPGTPKAGLPMFRVSEPVPDGPMCDDLLLLWLPRAAPEEPLVLRGAVVEVKFDGSGAARLDEARGEIGRTRDWLATVFNTTNANRPFRARDLGEIITGAAARARAFDLGRKLDDDHVASAVQRVVDGNYELDLRFWRGGAERQGLAIGLEATSTTYSSQGTLPTPGAPMDRLRLGKPVMDDLVNDLPLIADHWTPMTFEEPTGDSALPEDTPIADDPKPFGGLEPDSPTDGPASGSDSAAPQWSSAGTGSQEVRELAASLDAAMARYRLEAEPFDPQLAQVGPNIIRFRTKPLGSLGLADVERRAKDIGREVGAKQAVIVSQEPFFICVDVPRRERQPVPFSELSALAPSSVQPGALDFLVGVAPSGEIVRADLARLPHLLVAGATGSGKSVFLKGLLCDFVVKRSPDELRLLLIDPKQLDFRSFRSLPHLDGGKIVTEPLEAIEALKATIEREREPRLDFLEKAGVSSAVEYYEQGGRLKDLPQMVVLIDEFADLVSALPKASRDQFLSVVQRYVQITRAIGIYLVIATQRPSVDVISGPIKANLPARVALSLPSNRDSQTIIDRAGAEDLLGNGDLLFYVGGRAERLQAAFVGLPDIEAAGAPWAESVNPKPKPDWETS